MILTQPPVPRERLTESARQARDKAYAPYSGFACGAAVWANGEMYTGSNIENASYGLSCCAERVAIFKAVAAGHRHLAGVAVASSDSKLPLPCGACLQVMAEFAPGDIPIILDCDEGEPVIYYLEQLLPRPFQLKGGRE